MNKEISKEELDKIIEKYDPIYNLIDDNKYYLKSKEKYLKNNKNCKEEELNRVVKALERGIPLPSYYHDHVLNGKLKDIGDCHIRSNWVLLYEIDKRNNIITLLKTGTHTQVKLFESAMITINRLEELSIINED